MEFGKAFSYQFQDANWIKKLALTGVIGLIVPVVGGLYLYGWMMEIMRRVMQDHTSPLPDDLDFGGNIMRGLQALVIGFVYSIPMIIITLPINIVPIIGDAAKMSVDTLSTVVMVVSICCGGLAFLYGIFMGLMLPAAFGNFLDKGSLGAAFRIGEVFGLVKSAIGPFVLALLGGVVAAIIGELGVIVCIIGLFVTLPYAISIMAHLYGQAFKQAKAHQKLV